jgi:DNA adenine methylase
VKQYRTPLRYPGGKQKLAPFIDEVLGANGAVGWTYVEPYAGGAGVGIELLLRDRVRRVYLNDSSPHIYAFWKSILGQPEAFSRRISRCSLDIETWRRHREVFRKPADHDVLDVGFSTFYLNRCNRSGVLTGGVIGGLKQKGKWKIDARFPRTELIKRVEAIAAYSTKISISNDDAEEFLVKKVNSLPATTLVYCDPPYFSRADRLYLDHYKEADHARLAKLVQSSLKRPWLVSYDGHPHILSLYQKRRKFTYSLQYSAMEAYAGTEVFVFADVLNIPRTSSLPYVAAAVEELPARIAKQTKRLPAAG